MTPARHLVLHRVAESVLDLPSTDTVRVGIDGVDGAGKTSFADELYEVLTPSGRPLIRATVDRFHHSRSLRYRQGKDSPEGFFRESYDYQTLKAVLLDPLSPGGSGRFRRAVFDVVTDTPVDSPEEQAPPGSILLFDGMFLHRPELRGYWDFSVFLRVEWSRNHHLRKGPEADAPINPGDPRNSRYLEGQNLYFRECQPWDHATMVIDNDDLDAPLIVSSRT